MLKTFKSAAFASAIAAAIVASPAALAVYSDSLANFAAAGGVKAEAGSIYTYTFVGASAELLAFNPTVNIDDLFPPPFTLSTFQLSGLAGLTSLATQTFELQYTIELYAEDPASNADIRFQTIGLGSDVNSGRPDVNTSKEIVGQPTVVVPAPTFSETLNTVGDGPAATVTCGICRKFLVTDTINIGGTGNAEGVILSMSNTYDTTPLPEPGTLALFGLGFAALGARALRRKAKPA